MAAGPPLNWHKPNLDKWLKETFEGKAASKLSGPEVLAAHRALTKAQISKEEPAPEPAEATAVAEHMVEVEQKLASTQPPLT